MEVQANSPLQMGMIKPFGPSILKIKLPDVLVKEMNAYVDQILADEAKARALDHGPQLAGNVSQEFLLDAAFMEKIRWREFLGYACNEWLRRTSDKQLKDLQIIRSWVVRQFAGEYNPVHHHSGHISGAGYLKLPSTMGNTVQDNKQSNSNGNLVFLHGSPSLFSQAKFEVKPEVGDFYMFPAYLMHGVYPFSGTDEERRSISFNAILDPEASIF